MNKNPWQGQNLIQTWVNHRPTETFCPYQIDHDRGRAQGGITQRPAHHGTDMLLKLRAMSSLNRVVSGIMGPRCGLVHQKTALGVQQKLDRQYPNSAQTFGHRCSHFHGLGTQMVGQKGLGFRRRARHNTADQIRLGIKLHQAWIVTANIPLLIPHRNHGQFESDINLLFQQCRRIGQINQVLQRIQDLNAFAIVTPPGRLPDHRWMG